MKRRFQLYQKTLEDRTEVFSRMFMGFLPAYGSEIHRIFSLWETAQECEGGKESSCGEKTIPGEKTEKSAKNGAAGKKQDCFMNQPVEKEIADKIIYVLDNAKKGVLPVPVPPDSTYQKLIDEFRSAQMGHLLYTVALAEKITAPLLGQNSQKIMPHFMRSYGDMHAVLGDYVESSILDRKTRQMLNSILEKRKNIQELGRPLDLTYFLIDKNELGRKPKIHGWSVRRKTAERIAMKVAKIWYDLLKSYDISTRPNGKKGSDREFKVQYKKLLVTDMMGFSLLMPPAKEYKYACIFQHGLACMEFTSHKDDKLDTRELKKFGLDVEEYAQQHRLKMIDREGRIIDIHIDEIRSVITRLYGARAHDKYVFRMHEERLRDKGRIYGAADSSHYKTYGQFYREVYETMLGFFDKCKMASCEPTSVKYHTSKKKSAFLAVKLEELASGMDLSSEDMAYFTNMLPEYYSILGKLSGNGGNGKISGSEREEQMKKLANKGKKYIQKKLGADDIKVAHVFEKMRKKFDMPIYSLFSCYMYELEDMYETELGLVLEEDENGLKFDHESQKIFDAMNFLAGLYISFHGINSPLSRKIGKYLGKTEQFRIAKDCAEVSLKLDNDYLAYTSAKDVMAYIRNAGSVRNTPLPGFVAD